MNPPYAAPANGQPQAPQGAPQYAPPAQPAPQAQPQPPQAQPQPAPPIGGGYSGPVYQEQGPQFKENQSQVPQQQMPPQMPGAPQQYPQQQYQPPAAPQHAPQPAPQSQQPAQQTDALLAQLQSQGYDTSQYASGQEFLNAVTSAADKLQRFPQLEALANVGAQHLSQQGFNEPQGAPGQQPQAPSAEDQKKWNPPQWDPEWERFLKVDDQTGRYLPVIPELSAYANAANQYTDWQRQQAREFWKDPYSYTWEGIEPRVKDMLKQQDERIGQMSRYIEQMQLGDALAPYEQHLYQRDQQGNINYNALSQAGQAFDQAYRHSAGFSNNGRPLSVEERVRYALGQSQHLIQQPPQPHPTQPAQQTPGYQYQPQAQYSAPQQPAPQAVQPPPQPASNQNEFLHRALERAMQPAPQPQNGYGYMHQPNASGTITNSAAAQPPGGQNPNASFMDMAYETARQMGVSLDN